MRGNLDQLYSELERVPEDWSVRIRLIQYAVEDGELDEAKRLVRDSPDDWPLPAELQDRIHALLTGGEDSASTAMRPSSLEE